MPTDSKAALTAVVVAAARGPDDPVACAAGVSAKCLAPVHGKPMLAWVLATLRSARSVERIVLCGPRREELAGVPEIAEQLDGDRLVWMEPASSASASVARALEAYVGDEAVLVTSADHPLLEPETVDTFTAEALAGGADAAVGLVRDAIVRARYPALRRTVLSFSDDAYRGCNLFVLATRKAHTLPQFWARMERYRKRPLQLARTLGPAALLRFALGRLSLAGCMAVLSRRTGARVAPVLLDTPEAALDVDRPADWELAARVLAARGNGGRTAERGSVS